MANRLVDEYFESPALNQSALKKLLEGLDSYKIFKSKPESNLYYEEEGHFIIGSGVDCLLTQGKEEFDVQYYVSSSAKKPSDLVMSIIKKVFDESLAAMGMELLTDHSLSEFQEAIYHSCEAHSYFPNRRKDNWEEDNRYVGIVKDGEGYWNELVQSFGKQILSSDEYEIICLIAESLTTNAVTSKYFNSGMKMQYPIYFTYKNVPCKVLLDLVGIDYENKVIQPVDIKTMSGNTLNFLYSLNLRRYDIQAAFYTLALQIAFPGYKILPFKFIVETTSKNGIGNPLVYTCSQELLDIGRYGRSKLYYYVRPDDDLLHKGYNIPIIREVPGFERGIELYKWYEENGWDTDKRIVESKGNFTINFDEIINS